MNKSEVDMIEAAARAMAKRLGMIYVPHPEKRAAFERTTQA